MIRRTIKYIFLVALQLQAVLLTAQQYQIQQWSLEDGLSNSEINTLIQDQYGFMWIATDHGLNRFDGYEFKTYRYTPLDSTSIGANYITGLLEGQKGNIWAVLGIGGLSCLNRGQDQFMYYNYFEDNQDSTTNMVVHSMEKDTDHKLWVSSTKGLFSIDLLEKKKQPQLVLPHRVEDLPSPVYWTYQDQNKQLWLSGEEGIQRYDLQKDSLHNVYFQWNDTLLRLRHQANLAVENKAGKVWLGTDRGGVFSLDTSSGILYPHWREIDTELSSWQTVTGLFFDNRGKLWTSIFQYGLYYFDPEQDRFQHFPIKEVTYIKKAIPDSLGNIWIVSDENRLFKICDSSVEEIPLWENELIKVAISDIFVDRDNGVWLSTRGKGIWRVSKKQWPFQELGLLKNLDQNPTKTTYVTSLLMQADKTLWVGTENGLLCLDSNFQIIRFFHPGNQSPYRLAGYTVNCMIEDQNGQIWVGTPSGLSLIDPEWGLIRNFRSDPETPYTLCNNSIQAIHEDHEGRIWLGTSSGLNIYKPDKDQFASFYHDPKDRSSLGGNGVRSVIQTKNTKQYYVGLIGKGLNQVQYFPDQDSISCSPFFFQSTHQHSRKVMTINTLLEDQDEQLWIGGFSAGLLQFDATSQRLINGQSPINTIPHIAAIIEDSNQALWISANNGLWKYDRKQDQFRHFDSKKGLASNQFNLRAACKGPDGRLFFGNINGLNYFHPDDLQELYQIDRPLITNFRVYDQVIPFDRPIYEGAPIHLKHHEDFISFDFLSIAYDHPEGVQYAYKLEGFDREWHYCGTRRTASYTNLPGGTYQLLLKAGNDEGWWNPEITQLEIVVHPPFWNKPWFYGLILLLVVSLGILVYQLRWRIKMQQLKEIEKIREKAAADFHDELGHRLTKIALFSETVLRLQPTANKQLRNYLEKIKNNSDELYHSLRDFVWAMNPRKDSLFELAILLKDFGDELFDNTGIHFRASIIEENLRLTKLNMDWKRHLVLIFKEAMHNALKHAQCQNVTLNIKQDQQHLKITLEDDGSGFIWEEKTQGYGLGNMQNRAQKIGGTLEFSNKPGTGTHILFKGNIKNIS